MTLGGWITMAISVGFVTGLLAWCVWRVVRTPGATEHLHPPADLETHDVAESTQGPRSRDQGPHGPQGHATE